MLFTTAALLMSGAIAAQDAPSPPPAATDAQDSIVTLSIKRGDEKPRIASGFINTDGFVVTSFWTVKGATAITITTASQDSLPSAGVASYSWTAGVVALYVDWGASAPPPLELAPEHDSAAQLTLLAPGQPPVTVLASKPGENFTQRWEFFATPEDKLPFRMSWVGAPFLNKEGRVAGILQAYVFGMKASDPPEGHRGLTVVRPELLAALPDGDLIPWDQWPAREANIRSAQALATRARALSRKGDSDQAMAQARQAIDLDDRCWPAWVTVAYELWKAERDAEWLGALERSHELMPTDRWTQASLALAVARVRGEYDKAEQLARLAVKRWPKDPHAHYALGYVLHYQLDFEGAKAAYETALRLDPKNEQVRTALRRLRHSLGEDDPDELEPSQEGNDGER